MSNPQNLTKMRLQFGELNITPRVEERHQELDYTVQELQEAIADHKSPCDGEPSVYVGTYGKYNEGSLCGLWIDLSSFNDYDEFINFCRAIHADEEDPEIMCQDGENIPDSLCHESMGEKEFNNLLKYCDLCDEYNVSAVDDFLEFYSPDDLDRMNDAYVGVYDSEEDFAREIVNDCYDLEKMMGNLSYYFDYDALARDLFMCDYHFGSHGTVLRAF